MFIICVGKKGSHWCDIRSKIRPNTCKANLMFHITYLLPVAFPHTVLFTWAAATSIEDIKPH